MRASKSLFFILGCATGAFVTKTYIKIKSDKKDEKKDEAKEKGSEEKSNNSFREKSTIDDYRVDDVDRTDYTNITREYGYDPAESESPSESDLEELHARYKSFPPKEITEKEFGSFGYETATLYYSDEYDWLYEEGDEPYGQDDIHRLVGNILTDSGFENNGQPKIYIRNFRLEQDLMIIRSNP